MSTSASPVVSPAVSPAASASAPSASTAPVSVALKFVDSIVRTRQDALTLLKKKMAVNYAFLYSEDPNHNPDPKISTTTAKPLELPADETKPPLDVTLMTLRRVPHPSDGVNVVQLCMFGLRFVVQKKRLVCHVLRNTLFNREQAYDICAEGVEPVMKNLKLVRRCIASILMYGKGEKLRMQTLPLAQTENAEKRDRTDFEPETTEMLIEFKKKWVPFVGVSGGPTEYPKPVSAFQGATELRHGMDTMTDKERRKAIMDLDSAFFPSPSDLDAERLTTLQRVADNSRLAMTDPKEEMVKNKLLSLSSERIGTEVKHLATTWIDKPCYYSPYDCVKLTVMHTREASPVTWESWVLVHNGFEWRLMTMTNTRSFQTEPLGQTIKNTRTYMTEGEKLGDKLVASVMKPSPSARLKKSALALHLWEKCDKTALIVSLPLLNNPATPKTYDPIQFATQITGQCYGLSEADIVGQLLASQTVRRVIVRPTPRTAAIAARGNGDKKKDSCVARYFAYWAEPSTTTSSNVVIRVPFYISSPTASSATTGSFHFDAELAVKLVLDDHRTMTEKLAMIKNHDGLDDRQVKRLATLHASDLFSYHSVPHELALDVTPLTDGADTFDKMLTQLDKNANIQSTTVPMLLKNLKDYQKKCQAIQMKAYYGTH